MIFTHCQKICVKSPCILGVHWYRMQCVSQNVSFVFKILKVWQGHPIFRPIQKGRTINIHQLPIQQQWWDSASNEVPVSNCSFCWTGGLEAQRSRCGPFIRTTPSWCRHTRKVDSKGVKASFKMSSCFSVCSDDIRATVKVPVFFRAGVHPSALILPSPSPP